MLDLKCDICNRKLQEPGGLVFSPPTSATWIVEKYHVCKNCWPSVFAMLKNEAPDKHNPMNKVPTQ